MTENKKRVSFIKIRTKRRLGVRRKVEIVGKYYSRDEADSCTLEGVIYPAPVAYGIVKDFNSKRKNADQEHK